MRAQDALPDDVNEVEAGDATMRGIYMLHMIDDNDRALVQPSDARSPLHGGNG
jgi:hypothetical protein